MCWQCNVCQGGILGGREVYCVLGWCVRMVTNKKAMQCTVC